MEELPVQDQGLSGWFASTQHALLWDLLHYDAYEPKREDKTRILPEEGSGWVLLEELTGRQGPLRPSKLGMKASSVQKKVYLILNDPLIEARHLKHEQGSLRCQRLTRGGKWKHCKESAYRLRQDRETWIALYLLFAERYGFGQRFLITPYAMQSPFTHEFQESFAKLFGPMNFGIVLTTSYPRLFSLFLLNPGRARKIIRRGLKRVESYDELVSSFTRDVGENSIRLTGHSEFALKCGMFNQAVEEGVQKTFQNMVSEEEKIPVGVVPTRKDAEGGSAKATANRRIGQKKVGVLPYDKDAAGGI